MRFGWTEAIRLMTGTRYSVAVPDTERPPRCRLAIKGAPGGSDTENHFLKKNALEQAVKLVGEEVHRQYILNFQPKGGVPGQFHSIHVLVKDRPELQVKTRVGYWAVE